MEPATPPGSGFTQQMTLRQASLGKTMGTGRRRRALDKVSSCALTVALIHLWASTASAEEIAVSVEQLQDLPLEELLNVKIMTASLRPQEVREVPATTYVVTEQDFRMYGYRDLKDVLRNLPGIEYVYPNSHMFGGQRGFSTSWELTKLLVNGREVNALSNGAMFVINQFPLTGIKRIEVVQGPMSVLYGPEALSGVINIVTKDADNSSEGSELTGLLGGGDKSSQDTSMAFHSVARRGALALATGGYVNGGREANLTDFLKTSDYDQVNRDRRVFFFDNGNPYRDDHRNYRFNVDLAYSPHERIQIKTGALYLRGESGSGSEHSQLTYTNAQVITEQTHFYASGEYKFATLPAKSTLSYHFMVDNFWARTEGLDDGGDVPPLLVAFNFENSKLHVANLQVDVFPTSIDNYFLAGVGIRDTRLGEPAYTGSSLGDTTPGQPNSLPGRYLYPPAGYFSQVRPYLDQNRIYVYAQDQQSLWNKKIQLTAGIRYDHHSVFGGVLDVRSGLLLRPFTNYTVKLLFGQGFREPAVLDLAMNPDLSPARMNSGEVSFLFSPLRNLSGQIAYYQNRADKLIAMALSPSGSVVLSNSGQKRTAGVEGLLRYQVGPVGGDVWYCYEYSLDDQPLVGVPSNKLGFGGHYDFREHLSLAVRAKYTNKTSGQGLDAQYNRISASVPQYVTLDLHALAHDFELAGVRWDLSFSVFNLLGTRNYYPHALPANPSRFLAEGREYFGRVTVRY
jgi:outer membrane receptor protein involved in Fe transport